jgi:hypothetical protein
MIKGTVIWVLALLATLAVGCAAAAAPGHRAADVASPRQCSHPVLPSGDAARLWVPQAHAVQTFVCTDGTWVHVTGYGQLGGRDDHRNQHRAQR